MKDRIDPLIAERAPWLHAPTPIARLARPPIERLLGYGRTLELAEALAPLPAEAIFASVADLICRDVQATGLQNIPREGPCLIVANHPTGIADGLVLHHLLSPIRPDLYYFANRDILRVFPQSERLIAPVEWRKEKRSHTKTRETMEFVHAAMAEGRMGVIFPSGRLAKRTGLKLHERPWMASAAMLARRYEVPVIPLHLRARNSVLFYLFDLIHPTLRDITLFHEVLNKARQPYRVTVGRQVDPATLPARSEEAILVLREATLRLGGRHAPAVSLPEASRPVFRRLLRQPAQ